MAQFEFEDSPTHSPDEYADVPGDQPQELSQGVDQALDELDQRQNEQEELSEVEKRFDLASYYKLLLKHDFFDVVSPQGRQVEQEIRAFIKNRLEVLLGMRDSKDTAAIGPPPQFSSKEVSALKAIAARVLEKPIILTEKPKRGRPPTLKPATVMDVTPAPRPPAIVARPTLKATGPVLKTVKTKPPGKYKSVQKNAAGVEYVRDLTPQVRPGPNDPQPLPMPLGEAMTMISEQKAADVVSAQKFTPVVGLAVQHSLIKKEE